MQSRIRWRHSLLDWRSGRTARDKGAASRCPRCRSRPPGAAGKNPSRQECWWTLRGPATVGQPPWNNKDEVRERGSFNENNFMDTCYEARKHHSKRRMEWTISWLPVLPVTVQSRVVEGWISTAVLHIRPRSSTQTEEKNIFKKPKINIKMIINLLDITQKVKEFSVTHIKTQSRNKYQTNRTNALHTKYCVKTE